MLNVKSRSEEFFAKSKLSLPIGDKSIVSSRAIQAGEFVLRYGLAMVLVLIGGIKFTAFEAAAIQPPRS